MLTAGGCQPVLAEIRASNQEYKELAAQLKLRASAKGFGAVNEESLW